MCSHLLGVTCLMVQSAVVGRLSSFSMHFVAQQALFRPDARLVLTRNPRGLCDKGCWNVAGLPEDGRHSEEEEEAGALSLPEAGAMFPKTIRRMREPPEHGMRST